MKSTVRFIHHLYWRAGFGPGNDTYKEAAGTMEEEVDKLFKRSKDFVPLGFSSYTPGYLNQTRPFTREERTEIQKQEKAARIEAVLEIQNRFNHPGKCLREKMILFWMGHFACRIARPHLVKGYYDSIGASALGSFRELLHAMIRNAALLQYLNNDQNRKSHPNENFARELMELFTLGIGNYSEDDVKAAARAFTGWRFNKAGEFEVRMDQHDTEMKTFFGKTGRFDGNDIAEMILEKRECSRFIVNKLYSHFVNPEPDNAVIDSLSNAFYDSGYDIGQLMYRIFTSGWFYNDTNIGTRIKSPMELQSGMIVLFNIRFKNPLVRVPVQKILGQTLFNPPNVAGWPEGLSWIDSTTLLFRTRLPELYLANAESLVSPKEEFDAQEKPIYRSAEGHSGIKLQSTFDPGDFVARFRTIAAESLTEKIAGFLLMALPRKEVIDLITRNVSDTHGDSRILKTAIYVMCLPEYQVC